MRLRLEILETSPSYIPYAFVSAYRPDITARKYYGIGTCMRTHVDGFCAFIRTEDIEWMIEDDDIRFIEDFESVIYAIRSETYKQRQLEDALRLAFKNNSLHILDRDERI
jgi:hypothetical protein